MEDEYNALNKEYEQFDLFNMLQDYEVILDEGKGN